MGGTKLLPAQALTASEASLYDMTEDRSEWHLTTEPTRVRQWADEYGAVPIEDPGATAGSRLDVTLSPQTHGVGEEGGVERLPWDQFFELFEAEGLAFRYREGGPRDVDPACQLVDREEGLDPETDASAPTGETAQEVATDQLVASDTDEVEPIAEDPVESRSGHSPPSDDEDATASGDERARSPSEDERARSPSDDDLADPTQPGISSSPPERRGRTDASTDEDRPSSGPDDDRTELSVGSDEDPPGTAGDAETTVLVLDEIYEDPGIGSNPDDEYLVFRNAGDERLDLGRWRVENERGDSYEFPDSFTLDSGDAVTLYSGDGHDSDEELYWRRDDAAWDRTGGTVIVRDPSGKRVLREPYKDG